MKLRAHKTHRGLWCVLSLAAFVSIGLLVHFNAKGAEESLLRLMAEALVGAVRQGFDAFIFIWIGAWALVSVVIGWFLQSIVVLVLDWRPVAEADRKHVTTPAALTKEKPNGDWPWYYWRR